MLQQDHVLCKAWSADYQMLPEETGDHEHDEGERMDWPQKIAKSNVCRLAC